MQITLKYHDEHLLAAFRTLGEGNIVRAESGGITTEANFLRGELTVSGGFLAEFGLNFKCSVRDSEGEREIQPHRITFEDEFPASMGRPTLGIYHYPRNSGLRIPRSREPQQNHPKITCLVNGAVREGIEVVTMEASAGNNATVAEMRDFITSIRSGAWVPTTSFERKKEAML